MINYIIDSIRKWLYKSDPELQKLKSFISNGGLKQVHILDIHNKKLIKINCDSAEERQKFVTQKLVHPYHIEYRNARFIDSDGNPILNRDKIARIIYDK